MCWKGEPGESGAINSENNAITEQIFCVLQANQDAPAEGDSMSGESVTGEKSIPGDIGDPGIGYYLDSCFSEELLIKSVRNILNLAKIDKLSDTHGNTWYRFPYFGIPQIEKLVSEYEAVLAHKAD